MNRDDYTPMHPQIERQQKLAWCALGAIALIAFGVFLAS